MKIEHEKELRKKVDVKKSKERVNELANSQFKIVKREHDFREKTRPRRKKLPVVKKQLKKAVNNDLKFTSKASKFSVTSDIDDFELTQIDSFVEQYNNGTFKLKSNSKTKLEKFKKELAEVKDVDTFVRKKRDDKNSNRWSVLEEEAFRAVLNDYTIQVKIKVKKEYNYDMMPKSFWIEVVDCSSP